MPKQPPPPLDDEGMARFWAELERLERDELVGDLTDAWEKVDMDTLAPYCEVIPDGKGGTRLVMETGMWGAIVDELERRHTSGRNRREDKRARVEGFTSADHALRRLALMPSDEAAPVYLRIFRG